MDIRIGNREIQLQQIGHCELKMQVLPRMMDKLKPAMPSTGILMFTTVPFSSHPLLQSASVNCRLVARQENALNNDYSTHRTYDN